MSKKSFIIFLILSVIVTFGVAFGDAIFNKTSIHFGLPFKFASASLFGEANTNYLMLIVDVIFWFIILVGIWSLIKKVISK